MKDINSTKDTAKRVIHLYLLGKNNLVYTHLSLDYQTLYALLRSHHCRLMKIPRFPQKLRFLTLKETKSDEKVSSTPPKPLFFKTDTSDLEEEFVRGKELSNWALGALHTDSWTGAQKNFFVLVANKKNTPSHEKRNRKQWQLKKETLLRGLLKNSQRSTIKDKRRHDVTLLKIDISEELEGINQWRNMLDSYDQKTYRSTQVIR